MIASILLALSFTKPPVSTATVLLFAQKVTEASSILGDKQRDCLSSKFRQCRFKETDGRPVSFLDFKWDEAGKLGERNIWLRVSNDDGKQLYSTLIQAFGKPYYETGDVNVAIGTKWQLPNDRYVSFVHRPGGLTRIRLGFGKISVLDEEVGDSVLPQ